MKALILNSGLGTRLGSLTKDTPKCLTKITEKDTILSRQLRLLCRHSIKEIIITTGPFEDQIINHCIGLNLPVNCTFVNNPRYWETNYIYSIYCAEKFLQDDIILLHGDMVFSQDALSKVIDSTVSSMAVDSSLPLPEKDFKAVIEKGRIIRIGVEYFQNSVAAQPLYKLLKKDWTVWLNEMCSFCQMDITNCYGENAFNKVSDKCLIYPVDMEGSLCSEVDTLLDLHRVKERLAKEGLEKICCAN